MCQTGIGTAVGPPRGRRKSSRRDRGTGQCDSSTPHSGGGACDGTCVVSEMCVVCSGRRVVACGLEVEVDEDDGKETLVLYLGTHPPYNGKAESSLLPTRYPLPG